MRPLQQNERRGAIYGALVTYKSGGEWMRQGRINAAPYSRMNVGAPFMAPWLHINPGGEWMRQGRMNAAPTEYAPCGMRHRLMVMRRR